MQMLKSLDSYDIKILVKNITKKLQIQNNWLANLMFVDLHSLIPL